MQQEYLAQAPRLPGPEQSRQNWQKPAVDRLRIEGCTLPLVPDKTAHSPGVLLLDGIELLPARQRKTEVRLGATETWTNGDTPNHLVAVHNTVQQRMEGDRIQEDRDLSHLSMGRSVAPRKHILLPAPAHRLLIKEQRMGRQAQATQGGMASQLKVTEK